MPSIINENDAEIIVRLKIEEILEFQNIETDDISSWAIATNKLNLAAIRLGLDTLSNEMAGGLARDRINAISTSPAAELPTNTDAPVISGIPEYNQTLNAASGVWTGYPSPTFSYQWKADGINISDANTNQYLITASELGKVITVQVTATNLSGFSSATSVATAVVSSIPINSSAPVISGTVSNGQVLTTTNGSWIAFPNPTYAYQWKSAGVNISGATNSNYTLQNSDVGKAITVAVTATNNKGNNTSTSASTSLVTSPPINSAIPVIAAEAVVGTTITTTNGTWIGYPAITYAYQWKRNGVNISGATTNSYIVVSGDIGADISITVTATNTINSTLSNSIAKMAKPDWAATFDNWRNFATNVGDLANPTDIHATAINAPNASGVYSSFAANTLVRTDLGLQTVPTRTNSLRNNSGVGAVVGAPGTLPTNWFNAGGGNGVNREVVSTGISNGLPYVDVRFSGTASATTTFGLQLEINNQVAATSGQIWSGSLGAALIAGSLSGVQAVSFRSARGWTSGAVVSSDNVGLTLTGLNSEFQRFSQTVTLADATTAFITPQFLINYLSAAVVDVTFRIWAPQLEQGAFATPPILTTGSASTVNGNRQVITGLGPQLVTGVAGFVQFNTLGLAGIAGEVAFAFTDGSNMNAFKIEYGSSGALRLGLNVAGGASVLSPNLSPGAFTGLVTCAFIFSASQISGRVVGQAQANFSSPALPAGMNQNAFMGRGYNTTNNIYGRTLKAAYDYLAPGDDPTTAFNNAYAKAVLASAAP